MRGAEKAGTRCGDEKLAGGTGCDVVVPPRVIVYPRLSEALAALQRGDADFTITNATAERARVVDFAPALVDLELGVLVSAAPRLSAVEAMDQPGMTIGVSQGSTAASAHSARPADTRLRSIPQRSPS